MDKDKEILAAALRLFVTYGFHGTPTSKIAKAAGVANGTLFYYFKTKDELILALYNVVKNELNDFLLTKLSETDTLEEKMKHLYKESLFWALDHRDEFYFVQQFHFSPHASQVSPADKERQTRMHLGLLNEGLDQKIFKPISIGLIGNLIGNHVYGVHQYLISNEFSRPQQEEVIDETFQLLWEMLTNRK